MKATTGLFFVALLAISSVLMACAGMDFGDIVQVETPVELQRDKGYPKRMSLNDSRELYQADLEDHARNMATWKGNIESGDQFAGILTQLTLQQINDAGPAIAGVPVLGPAMPIVTGLAAWWLQGIRTQREKRDSYNKGLKVGANTATQAAQGIPATLES